MRRLLSIIKGYLLLIGILAHVGFITVWLLRPDVIDTIRTRMTAKLIEQVPMLASVSTNAMTLITWEQVRQQLPAWQPLPLLITSNPPTPNTARIGDRTFDLLTDAAAALQPDDTLDIGAGIYNTPLVITADNVTIIGHGHVILEHGTAEGKGNILIKGNGVKLRNIECRLISVPDRNGACVRLEGENLFLDHVYFHDGEQGLLTGGLPGFVHIRDSRFERLGAGGLAHAVYMGKEGKLLIEKSWFLASKDQGHEIKSRAHMTTISDSLIASLSGDDSRLIDISNGGQLVVENSILAQGPNSSNGDAIGFALEGSAAPGQENVILRNNVILLERHGNNRLLHLGNDQVQVTVTDNVIVSEQPTGYESGNMIFKTRAELGLPPYPALPLERQTNL
ncbi:hypothetical protein [Thiospirillum jenense]|uniref:Right handed beta helix domain-containing protein n=1 Tax=Thiospirillum jenense TaxID=1653858 RepID=A0A839HG23_9GAMM|nr:hypothetical protein [Thiospirillum jenense]MBB1126266.1 hypothetical protein [Thiospirillum jenense]